MSKNSSPSRPASAALDQFRMYFGKRVTGLVRFSWWPAIEAAVQCNVAVDHVFAGTVGPLAIQFDDDDDAILGVASDSALNSIIVWDEASRRKISPDSSLLQDDDFFQISASDERFASVYWRDLIGCSLVAVHILKRASMSEKEKMLPSEVGLRLLFDNKSVLIASHGLIDGTDDFSILEGSQIDGLNLQELRLT
jgi:hypothetical protein